MASITQTVPINAPIEKVFGLITDPAGVAPFIPGLVGVNRVQLPLHAGSSFDWEFQFLGMNFRGTYTVEELRAPHLYLAYSSGGIQSRWMYTLVPKDGASVVTLDIDYGPPTTLLKKYMLSFIEPHTSTLAMTYLTSLKTYLESMAGTGKQKKQKTKQ